MCLAHETLSDRPTLLALTPRERRTFFLALDPSSSQVIEPVGLAAFGELRLAVAETLVAVRLVVHQQPPSSRWTYRNPQAMCLQCFQRTKQR